MGFLKLFSGIARIFKRHEPVLLVTKIKFAGQISINYATYPQGREPYIKIPAGLIPAAKPPYADFRKSKPDPAENHWEKEAATDDTKHSWPVALIRRGGNQYAQWTADVTVKLNGLYKGDINIKATCQTKADDGNVHDETLKVPETKITFNNEDEKTVSVSFDGIPDTVRHMGKLEISWEFKTVSMAAYKPANITRHCLFVINAKPLVPKKLQVYDYFLFEIFDWSCKWADGKSAVDEIEKAIWQLFHPFDPVQDNTNKLFKSTGLYYWTTAHLLGIGKNIQKPFDPYQKLPDAIMGKWDTNTSTKCSASCIVFDRIFMGSLGIQGIPTQEIVVRVTGNQLGKTFGHKGKYYKSADCFAANSRYAQGNKNAPEVWSNHWIAFVYKGQGNCVPLVAPGLYDPSYGGNKIANINQAQDALIEYEKGVKGYLTTTVPGKKDYIIPRAEMARQDYRLETIVNVELT